MRIRSIKPEFWRSDDISQLPLEDRLLFIGLWSYVDDNGVGRDRLAEVCADLFAHDLERDPRDTFARVSRGLAHLSDAGLIYRYTVDGRDLMEIVTWNDHQRIDRPAKPRLPRYDADRDTLASPSRHPREVAATGTGEQGNRGTGDQGAEEQSSPSDADASDEAVFDAEVIRLCELLADGVRANGHKVGTVGKQWWSACDRLMRLDGYTAEQIEWLIRWTLRDEFWAANIRSMSKFREKFSTLKAQAQAHPHGRGVQRQSYVERREEAGLALVAELEREEANRGAVGGDEAAGLRRIG